MSKGDDSLYTPEMTAKTYQRVLALGAKLAAQGFTVILDAKYDRQSLRAAVVDLAADRGLPVQMIHCTAPADILRDRLADRTGGYCGCHSRFTRQSTGCLGRFYASGTSICHVDRYDSRFICSDRQVDCLE